MKTIFVKDMNFEPLPDEVCAAIGNFDGVHLGHQKLIEECKRHNLKSAVLTFYPHPSIFIKNIKNYPLITPIEKKIDVIARLGIDYLIIVDFTVDILNMPKDEFIIKMKQLNIKSVVCGYDFTFGRKAEGTIKDLAKEFEFYEVKKYSLGDIRVSSTHTRELITEGNVAEAARFLGRKYSIKGKVIYGSQNGRMIGFPTANINYSNFILPKCGVYYVNVYYEGYIYLGMANIGHNPTFNYNDSIRLEVNIFNLDEDIYDNSIEVFFIDRIRDEIKFNSKEELIEQLKSDKKRCIEIAGSDNFYTK